MYEYAATNQLQVPVTPLEWASSGPRRVSVSNLGFGGTNAHAILEEAPAKGTMLGAIDMPTGHISENGNDRVDGYDPSSLMVTDLLTFPDILTLHLVDFLYFPLTTRRLLSSKWPL